MTDKLRARAGHPAMIGHPEGWDKLVADLDEALSKTDPDYVIYQTKEKSGGLRFYTGPLSDEGHDLVAAAEYKSFAVCERCGQPGEMRFDRRWYRTLCDEDR